MSMEMTQEIYDALKGIRASFLNDLIGYRSAMESHITRLGNPDHALTAVAALQGIVHKISGIAGSIGFPQLGEEAGNLDVAFGKIVSVPYDAAAIETIQAPLNAFLGRLENTLNEAATPFEQGPA